MRFSVIEGDVLKVLPNLEPGSFDAVLCDPPYGLSFMGKGWDHGVPGPEVWTLVARALKPGAHVLAFGGTRTFHRLTCAIEDAGFEIRDCLSWLYGQGFPKSLDISKAIDKASGVERPRIVGGVGSANTESLGKFKPGEAIHWQGYGTALKPAWEPVVLAMKPTRGTFAENALREGVAGLNVDGGRIETDDSLGGGNNSSTVDRSGKHEGWQRPWMKDQAANEAAAERSRASTARSESLGRWPANVLLDEESAKALDEMSGDLTRWFNAPRDGDGKSIAGTVFSEHAGTGEAPYSDSGGASRFFYVAKASREEREAGLREAACRTGLGGEMPTDDDGRERDRFSKRARNHHPTVKPIALCEYLAKLLLPPKRDTPRRILVPFSGSGSEMIGALAAGWDEVVGIEREHEYAAIANARLAHHARELVGPLFLHPLEKKA